MGWTSEDEFEFFVPAQIVKSSGKNKDGKRWIQGIASTSSRDLQGEIVSQKGIDFTYFLKHGYFNNDHKDGFDNKVGEPTECRLTKNGLWVKGLVYKNKKVADDIWEMMNSLNSSGAKRRIGFSIQGKVVKRNGKNIERCWIQDIAITPAPVNTTTWAEIAKSLSAQTWDFDKSVNAASDCEEEEEKALGASGGSPLVPESLDGKEKNATDYDKVNKSFSFEETVELLMKSETMTQEGAEATARVIFSMNNLEHN